MTRRRTAAKAIVLPTMSLRTKLAILIAALALLAMPHFAQAQGIVGGAQQGSRDGYRAAGPVGGLVGGAIGAGVGGAVGGVRGVLGIPDERYDGRPVSNRQYRSGKRCRGYYTRSGRFRCYR